MHSLLTCVLFSVHLVLEPGRQSGFWANILLRDFILHVILLISSTSKLGDTGVIPVTRVSDMIWGEAVNLINKLSAPSCHLVVVRL